MSADRQLLIADGYQYALTGLRSPDPESLARRLNHDAASGTMSATDVGGTTSVFSFTENAKGGIHMKVTGEAAFLHVNAQGAVSMVTDEASATHLVPVPGGREDLVNLDTVHADEAGRLRWKQNHDAVVHANPPAVPGTWLGWQPQLETPGPNPRITWLNTYQPALRHSPGFFLARVRDYLDQAGVETVTNGTAIRAQLTFGLDTYDPSGQNPPGVQDEATVDAGVTHAAHPGFYNENGPDDELKQPPDWEEVKTGLDDAGFPG